MRRATRGFLLLILTLLAISLVSAQGELLQNPSLDEGSQGPYTTRRGGEFPIYLPNGWNVWLAAQSGDFYNRGDRTTINPHPGPGPSPQDGNRAVNIDCGYVTCTAALYQQVSVEEDTNVQASAWAQVKACNIAENADNCGSAVESGAQTRIGIDPNGGTDPGDSDIVWSNWVQPHDQWLQMSVSATTTGTTATLFLYSTQANTAQLNRTYWDAATMTGGGEGGVADSAPDNTPVPTAPPSVPFVVPQNEGDDGSIVHRVQAGDTIDSIAVAYGLSRSEILELNPNISDPRIISLGQEIVIREPQASSRAGDDEESSEEDDEAESTEEAESDPDTVPSGGINLEEEVTEEPLSGTAVASAETNGEESDESEEVDDEAESESTDEPEVSPATLTPAPVVAADLPASDPSALTATVCVSIFNDANQNRLQEPDEALLPGGSVQLSSGADVLESVETSAAPECFEEVANGNYVLAASPPDGYGLTSPVQFRLEALAGSELNVAFGAAEGVQAVQPPPADEGGIVSEVESDSPEAATSSLSDIFNISGLIVFGVAGFVLVVGMGLTLFLRRR